MYNDHVIDMFDCSQIFLILRRTEANCRVAITLTWVMTLVLCIPLLFSHGEFVPPDTEHAYCMFLDNQTIALLPESWNARWSTTAFYVSFLC